MKGWYAGGHREEQKNEFGSLEVSWASARRPGRAESATSSYSAALASPAIAYAEQLSLWREPLNSEA